jgi:hypothetical protein
MNVQIKRVSGGKVATIAFRVCVLFRLRKVRLREPFPMSVSGPGPFMENLQGGRGLGGGGGGRQASSIPNFSASLQEDRVY